MNEETQKYIDTLENLINHHRVYELDRFELLVIITSILVPRMLFKPRMWEKILKMKNYNNRLIRRRRRWIPRK
jgi:hypothetical protein